LLWRYTNSINWHSWPLAFALLAAETYSFIGACLFGLGMWRWRRRSTHPRPRGDETVDVFITCYNEPVAIVRETVRAALAIRHPANVYLCDDGASPAMRAMAAAEGCGYLTRSEEWDGKERHAKAGNLTNALNQTSGEFVLILDADQMPLPEILDETLGYFADPKVAFVQTPQWFRNIAAGDPLGNQAPLFYGPIQEAKDGWNASFFCGSNAVLRRDALLHAGLVNYSRDLERQIGRMLDGATRFLNPAARQLRERGERRYVAAVEMVRTAVSQARAELQAGEPLAEVTYRFQRRAQDAARVVIAAERGETAPAAPDANDRQAPLDDDTALIELTGREHSPLREIGPIRDLLMRVDVDRSHEAVPVMPLSTISVTEDLSTAMRIHSLGYSSVYHPKVLAHGLAPEDLRSAMQQRLRWAQGTIQVMLRENPLTYPGLAPVQRLMYFATMWSYLFGFFAVVYLAAPVLYLLFGWTPVEAYTGEFLRRLIPYLVANQILFLVVSWRLKTWRGQQYNLALFPVWIHAVVSTVRSVFGGRRLDFVVTPKGQRQGSSVADIRWQVVAIGALAVAVAVGLVKLALGDIDDRVPITINILWALYDLLALSVVIWALARRPAATAT
ncbi:MAG TPA: glycosyltransferase, partial [Thermomicrobiales bacterium]|nr:glycosyltransferase [Thermomicrobiales bacterium]